MILSIIVPVYNSKNTLNRLVKSLDCPSRDKDYEVIFVDDGSTDGGGYFLAPYVDKYDNFTMIRTENRGVSSARNTGIKLACGDYYMFVDADDALCEGAIEQIIDEIKKYKSDLIAFSFKTITEKDGKTTISNSSFIHQKFNFLNDSDRCKIFLDVGFAPWRKCYRAQIIQDDNVLFPEKMKRAEDGVFNVRFQKCINSCTLSDKIIYEHYIQENSLSSSFDESYISDLSQCYYECKEFLLVYGNQIDVFALKKRFFQICILLSSKCNSKKEKRLMLNSDLYKELKIIPWLHIKGKIKTRIITFLKMVKYYLLTKKYAIKWRI